MTVSTMSAIKNSPVSPVNVADWKLSTRTEEM
jgi:hypothetical protein